MGFVAAGIVGAAVIGSIGAENAANTQSGAANAATGVQSAEFQQTLANEQPWMDAGKTALGEIQTNQSQYNQPFTLAQFHQDPGYQFSLQQGQNAIQASAAAKGLLNSGGTLKSLDSYTQGLANQDYQQAFTNYQTQNTNSFNRLAALAGIGQVANNTTAAAGTNAANQIGQNTIGAGNAQAAAQIGQTNAITGGINTGMNTWMNQSYMNQMFPQQNSPGVGYGGFQPNTAPSGGFNPSQGYQSSYLGTIE